MKTILLTGGNFINKGAESMLLSTVAGIREHFPDYEPVLIDMFPSISEDQKKDYNFRIVNLHVRTLLRISFPWIRPVFKGKPISDDEKVIKELFRSATALFDLSGYGLSSHNQALLWSFAGMLPIKLARKHDVPVWLLPQSIGPFEFKGLKKMFFKLVGRSLLEYPEIIFVREPAGLRQLREVRSGMSLLSPDIVLQSQDAFNVKPTKGNEVLVIPNRQLFKLAPESEVLKLYADFIHSFLDKDVPVKVIRHSRDDLDFCIELSNILVHKLLTIDKSGLSLPQLIELISDARMVVTGRYHGAIHALKMGKPVIIIGWAEKYQHLANSFGIEKYFIDLRNEIIKEKPREIVDALIEKESVLSKDIRKVLENISYENFWSQIKLRESK